MKLDEIDILYHGTGMYHEQIQLRFSAPLKDFGRGYYVTSQRQQAVDWARNRGKRRGEYTLSPVPDDMRIKELLRYDAEWLDFIIKHRIRGEEAPFDIVYDRMADNKWNTLSQALQEYAYGHASAQRTLDIIRFYQSHRDQYCFKTPAAVRLLNRVRTHTYRLVDGKWKEAFV